MVEKNVLSAICDFLVKKRDSHPRLAARLSDEAIQNYVRFCQNIDDNTDSLPCPLCMLTKGRIQHLLPPRPFQIKAGETHLICEFCYEKVPLGSDA